MITVHHIVFDGVSALLFIRLLWEVYQDCATGRKPLCRPPQATYFDFVEWEQKMMAGPRGRKHLRYWKEALAGDLVPLSLPLDHPRPSLPGFKGHTLEAELPPALGRKLKETAKKMPVSLPVLFLGAFQVLLYRYTGQEDIAVGMPTLGRPEERFRDLVGYFVNMIVIRTRLHRGQTFAELLKALCLTVADGLDHATFPFPALVKELNLQRDPSVAPLYQVSFAYQNFMHGPAAEGMDTGFGESASVELVKGVQQEGADDLGLEIYEEKEGFLLKMDYRQDLLRPPPSGE